MVFYGQGIKTAKGHCKMDQRKHCFQNRFLLKAVGTAEQECEFTKEIPWWSEWREIFTHEGVLSQNQIDDNDISSDKLRKDYVVGRIENRKLKIT